MRKWALTVLLLLMAIALAFASTAGPNPAGTGSTSGTCNGISTFCWSAPGNITGNDGVFASVAVGPGGTSNQLQATNFGFAIAAGSTINGIQVDTENQSGNPAQLGLLLQMLKAGAAAGVAKSLGQNSSYPNVEAFVTLGGNSDLWGTTWTPGDINGTGFGIQQQALELTGLASATANVDFIRITITFTPPAPPPSNGRHRVIQTQIRTVQPKQRLPRDNATFTGRNRERAAKVPAA